MTLEGEAVGLKVDTIGSSSAEDVHVLFLNPTAQPTSLLRSADLAAPGTKR